MPAGCTGDFSTPLDVTVNQVYEVELKPGFHTGFSVYEVELKPGARVSHRI